MLLRFCLVWYCLQLVVTHDFFYCLQSHRRSVNDLSTAVQLTNRLLRFWADEGFVYHKRVSSPSFLVQSQSLNNNISWFAIALDQTRTRQILREKVDCQQSIFSEKQNESIHFNCFYMKLNFRGSGNLTFIISLYDLELKL